LTKDPREAMNPVLLAAALLAGVVESAGEVAARASAPAARFSLRPEGALRPVGENGPHVAGSLMLKGGGELTSLRGGEDTDCRGNCLVVTDAVCKNTKKCELVPCPNFPVCGNESPQTILDCHKGRCWDCSTLLPDFLTFVDATSADAPCPVCSQPAPLRVQMHYSHGCQAQHKICVPCFKKPKGVLDSAKEPLPQDYGCPWPPNEGLTEEEEEAAQETWRETQAAEHEKWDAAMDDFFEARELRQEEARKAMARCPLCL